MATRITDPHCGTCRGTGHASDGRMIDGEWWETFFDCYCVEYQHTPESAARLKRILAERDARAALDHTSR